MDTVNIAQSIEIVLMIYVLFGYQDVVRRLNDWPYTDHFSSRYEHCY